MTTWFTADLHFGHKNIIEFCKRPFENVEQMDEMLIQLWNERVLPLDDVYVVGDISFHKLQRTLDIIGQLKGRKYLITGNHDRQFRRSEFFRERFEWVKDLAMVNVPDNNAVGGVQRIVLCHYAMRVWEGSHYGTWQLYGHSHGTLPDDPSLFSLDVGVDSSPHLAPFSYADLVERMVGKVRKIPDGRTEERR